MNAAFTPINPADVRNLALLRSLFTRPAIAPGEDGAAGAPALVVDETNLVRIGAAIFDEVIMALATNEQFKALGRLIPPLAKAGAVGGMLEILKYGDAPPAELPIAPLHFNFADGPIAFDTLVWRDDVLLLTFFLTLAA